MNDVASLGVGSVGGAVVSELLKLVIEEAKLVLGFKSVLKELVSTIHELLPLIIEIESLQGDAGELKNLNDVINEVLVVVHKCSQVKPWNLPSKAKYTRKIHEINNKMLKFCQIQLQLILLRNQRLIMRQQGFQFASLSDLPSHESHELPVDTVKAIESHLQIINKKLDVLSVSPPVYSDPCSVPKIDKVPVGLDLPLMEVKKKLLDDDDDHHLVSLVVSAPPGCGKTTLVTQLCHDDEIKERFEHIFFCVVSSAPNFRTIVQNLLEHNGYEALTFENDSQAVVGLSSLLEELKEDGPILLVLDDVWAGAESFLQKYKIDIPNFKILVTSRFEFPSFGPTYHLKPLGDEDALTLLVEQIPLVYNLPSYHHYTFLGEDDQHLLIKDDQHLLIKDASRCLNVPLSKFEDHLQKILNRCYGFPLLIEVLGPSFLIEARDLLELGQVVSWYEEETTLDNPHPTVLECLQPSFNVLKPHLKECLLDMGSFLEYQKIRASVIVDIWVELYGEGSSSSLYMKYLNDLASKNVLKLIPPKDEQEECFYNEFLVTQHDILRELALFQSISEENHERKRLNLETRDDEFPDWCLDLMHPINARLLSISTDDLFSSTWVEMDCPNVEALVLHLSSSNYALPNFIATMKKLKVVVIINHGHSNAKMTNLSCLSSLPNLKRIRFEKISTTLLDILQSGFYSLEKLSLFMCSLGEVFYDKEKIDVPYKALPSLQEIDIDCCYDLNELPYWISEVVSLKILSITNCHKLTKLPEAIGNLSKLEVIRLSSCINLSELPETMDRLGDLRFLDIFQCLGLRKLPLEIGKLQKLKKISMRKCSVCDLPDSVKNLEDLEVNCDKETGLLWVRLEPKLKNLTVFEKKNGTICVMAGRLNW